LRASSLARSPAFCHVVLQRDTGIFSKPHIYDKKAGTIKMVSFFNVISLADNFLKKIVFFLRISPQGCFGHKEMSKKQTP